MNGEENTISVFVVAASPIIRAGLKTILETVENLVVIGSAAEISAASFNASPFEAFDILLINVERDSEFAALLEFLNGEASSEEVESSPFIVALLDFQNSRQAIELLRSGARGVLSLDATAGEISAAVTAAANDLIVAQPEILERLFTSNFSDDFSLEPENKTSIELTEDLTASERDVLELLAEGESNKIIALRLNISEHTVKFHVASIFGKLGVGTRTEAVTFALRRGLILL